MHKHDAIEALTGHHIIAVESAQVICDSLGVFFSETLIIRWESVEEAFEKYDFNPEQVPGSGVDTLDLSYHVAEQLGLGSPGKDQKWRGAQAGANRQAIRQHFIQAGKL